MPSKELKSYSRDEIAKHNKEGDLWIIIDGNVYDISRFKDMHPGGASVFLDEDIPGQDATEAFYGLHRHEIITKPQYARLVVGVVEGEKSVIHSHVVGELSKVPYAEPTWLSDGYYSPYYNANHRTFQKAIRTFYDEVVTPDALAREVDGKPPSKSVIEAMDKLGIHAMRMGPGKHLKGIFALTSQSSMSHALTIAGLKLMDGLVTPEQVRPVS
ncbi:hypothetical protein C0991_010742 [Blastosporella zonata]|nr:hypothetical protein C0991_010742 [Blastosporella zonata]